MQRTEATESVLALSVAQSEALQQSLAANGAIIHDGLSRLGTSLIIAAAIVAVAIVVHGLLTRRKSATA